MGARAGQAPRVSQWVLPVAEVEKWFERAQTGASLVYAKGEWLMQGATADFVRDLALAGVAHPLQPRAPEGGFHYTIKKLGEAPEAEGAACRPRIGSDDEALQTILRTFRRQANLGLRASTNPQLAKLAGLATTAQAAWRVTRLVELKLIRTQVITTGAHAGWRIVTIMGSGRSTLAPPNFERAKAQVRQEQVR